jgi:outer membrane receptor protein involved in Fe transport
MQPTKHKIKYAALPLGAFIIAGASAQTSPAPAAPAAEDEVIVLSPFEVTDSESSGYVATSTLAGSRINTQLKDVGSAISVVTAEFLKDTGATDSKTLLQYTTNTEVASIQGNFTGASTGNQTEEGTFTTPNSNTRVRGLTSADNTRGFFITDIPWDSYNVDRVDMQRGANSILFGMGSPAGIINTTTKTAQFRNFGELEFRYGSYDTNRVSLDYNQCLLEDELAMRVDLLRNDEKYKQKPAFSLDQRIFLTGRYEPKFLNKNGIKTSVKVNYESGAVRSNNPRVITPIDMITPWFTSMNQASYDPSKVLDNTPHYTVNASNNVTAVTYNGAENQSTLGAHIPVGSAITADASVAGGSNPNYNPWLTNVASSYSGGPVTYFNADGSAYMVASGYANIIGARKSDGTTKTTLDALPNAARVAIASTATYASNAGIPYKELYKSSTFSDTSVFDFYNNLLDGKNKKEWQNFHNFSGSINQTFFNQKCGYEISYDESVDRRGQFSLLTDQRAGIAIDINTKNLDGTTNTNYGKAYIADSGIYGNSDIETNREAARANVFVEHNFNEDGKAGWFYKLLGRHTLSGLYSQDMVQTDTRSFLWWGTGLDLAALVTDTPAANDIKGNTRTVHPIVYISDSLAGKSLSDVSISRAGDAVVIPSTIPYTYFSGTWKADSSVGFNDPWTNSLNGQVSTQSQNPANYVGWTTKNVTTLNADNSFEEQDALTYSATLLKKKSDSRAAVLQSYFWDGAIVGMYGIRRDTVKSWSAGGFVSPSGAVDFDHIDTSTGEIAYGFTGREASIDKKNSPSWSIVAHLNKFFGKLGDRFPINISLYYNESENFQVVGTRFDMYGNAIPAASGTTKDRGITFATKDDMFSLRINKYESSVLNASSTSGLNTWLVGNNGDATIFAWGETWADVYDYRLGTTGVASSADTNSGNWTYGAEGSMTAAQADALRLSSVAAWRTFTSNPKIQQVLKAFGYNDFAGVSTRNAAGGLPNFSATEDQTSKGYEFELTANPTKNWRISANASKTEAIRNNVGGTALNEVVEIMNNAFNNTDAGQIRLWGGGNLNNKVVSMWNSAFYNSYVLMKLQEGTYAPELRKWRFNVVTNYNFTEGRLKGFNVGAGYRWQDKIAIGYPVAATGTSGVFSYDINNPIMGPREDAIDFWIGYEKKLTEKINWRIQFNIRNLGDGNKVIPLTIQPTTDPTKYTVAAWRIAPGQTWEITNTFKF